MVGVYRYTKTRLTRLFQEFCDDGSADKPVAANRSGETASKRRNHHVAAKHHIEFFVEFMRDSAAQTIVVEEDYIDRDFLEDFAAYHVRSFYPYRRRCARLHFFASKFGKKQFLEAVDATPGSELTPKSLQADYIGFMVIKPLPSTVVGRTCFRPYPHDKDAKRLYPTIEIERVDLFGLKLEVKTLPFQEQDRDVAACASSALWSVFHATGRLFQHAFPSPVQITAAATQRISQDDRVLPNGSGLTSRQMADAIRSVGLEPYLIGLTKGGNCAERTPQDQASILKIAIAAYARLGIPCLLQAMTCELQGIKPPVPRGSHAMAVSGYRMPGGKPAPYGSTGTLFAATRMTKIYAHDDQVGPFARMEFRSEGGLMTSQVNDAGHRLQIVAYPQSLMVPLYHKVRIPFVQVINLAISIDEHLRYMHRNQSDLSYPEEIVWDLELTTLEKFREEVRGGNLNSDTKRRILTSFMPRFLWQLRAADLDGKKLFDLLFDPTDLVQGRLYLDAIAYDLEAFTGITAAIAVVNPGVWPELPLSTIQTKLFEKIPEPTAVE